MKALDTQVGGSHYKDLKIQPVEYMHANKIPFIEGCIIKYATRWRDKGGIADLEKIKHFAQLLIDLEQETVKESLTAEADPDGWIKWDGGECPVDDSQDVSVKFKSGKVRRDKHPEGWSGWGVNCPEPEYKIIAYRIHKAGE